MTSLLQKISLLPLHQQLELIQLIAKGLQSRGQEKIPYNDWDNKVEVVFPKGVYPVDKTDTTIE